MRVKLHAKRLISSAGILILIGFSLYLIRSPDRNRKFVYETPRPCKRCPGELGEPVYLTGTESIGQEKEFAKEFFNARVSEKISLWRSLPDYRHQACKYLKYPIDLPTASVIFIFKNERRSVILRSIYSVINRSPRHLLKEVILVDDASDLEELKQPLTDYCQEHFGDIVRIHRSEKRLGLIVAKNFGGKQAIGDVIIFLDAHIEATEGWLEPLLARIKEKPSAVVCPIIDNIDARTLAYNQAKIDQYGVFSWDLLFRWGSIPDRISSKRKSPAAVYPSPTMAGGLLAASREYFFAIGGYDDDMEIWGGENLELSFRTWMCGGSLEFVPCSRVGHIFRAGHPYDMVGEKAKRNILGRNSMRLAEVWLDEYKETFYAYKKYLKINTDPGDISKRLQIREDLKCHSFQWYLDNVIPEKFMPNKNCTVFGQVRSLNSDRCLDVIADEYMKRAETIPLNTYKCQNDASKQVFTLSKNGELRRELHCAFSDKGFVSMSQCDGSTSQKWSITDNWWITNFETGLCMNLVEQKAGNNLVSLEVCDPNSVTQKWSFEHSCD